LDFITYGMVPQRLWLLGGYTSVGKSWLGIHFFKRFIEEDKPVLFISTEMSIDQVQARLISSYTDRPDIPMNNYMRGMLNKEQEEAIQETVDELAKKKYYIVDSAFKLSDIVRLIRYHQVSHGIKGVFVDYVQNIYVDDFKSEYQTLNDVSRKFQQEAINRELFICTFSQVNRASVAEDSQVMGFRGSGNLEAAADVAMTIKRDKDDDKARLLKVQKNRHGGIDDIKLNVNFEYGGIYEAGGNS
jgi:replicative DNA helicase